MKPFEDHGIFIEETRDLLHGMELALMRLESDPENRDDIDQVFRALHSIKGSSGMFGFDHIAGFVHDLENRFESIRNGNLKVEEKVISDLLASSDAIKVLLDNPQAPVSTASAIPEPPGGAPAAGNQNSAESKHGASESSNASATPDDAPCPTRRFTIRFVPHAAVFKRGVQIAPLFDELRALGKTDITADASIVPTLDKLDPESAYISWTIKLETTASRDDIQDVFVFVEGDSYLTIEDHPDNKPCDLVSLDLEASKRPELRIVEVQKRRAESSAQNANPAQNGSMVQNAGAQSRPSIRVASEKLDDLVNLVGELVTLQSRLSDEAGRKAIPEFQGIAENLERLSSDLRDKSLAIRMVPLADTFVSFKRPVHDIARELGKKVELRLRGAETEIDKSIADRLRDPLIHLLRNAVDHGIETPAQRATFGKPEEGLVLVSAERRGQNIIIDVSDDGRGLNRAAIFSKALERGLIHSSKELKDEELYALIFEPGFSTAAQTTAISGRGVGMDVVRREIEALGGHVDISTASSSGTHFTLSIPLTLAIVDGFMVEIAGQKFILNMNLVRECLSYDRLSGKSVLNLRDELVPTIDLRQLFKKRSPEKPDPDSGIVVFQAGQEVYGLVVDRIVGKHQTVIKRLSARENPTGLLEGASILGDGSIALILDLPRIVQYAKSQNVSQMPQREAVQSHMVRRIG